MRRRERLKKVRKLIYFFRDKRCLQKQFYDQNKNEKHKEIHLSKSHVYMDLEHRAISLVCKMHEPNKPMIKDIRMIRTIKKIRVNPNLITAIGFVSLIIFIRAIMIGDVLIALLTLIIAAILFTVLKTK